MPDEPSNPNEEPIEISIDMIEPIPVAARAPAAPLAVPAGARDAGGRVDFERGMGYFPPVTLALIAACVGVFVWQVAVGSLASAEAIVAAGANFRPAVVGGGQWWRLASSMFLHGSVEHLVGNVVALYILGMACEHAFGRGRMLFAYTAAGLCGAALSVAMLPGPSVGASGAIFGLSGAIVAFLLRRRHTFYVRDNRVGVVLLLWAAAQLGLGLLSPQVDNYCHAGGLVAGAVLGLVLPGRKRAA